ncbi:beta sliding clamp-like [Calliopsis andreniformis]|uniref:beta sliding clamp-like n=1 Tax=Calliopsis andreniformis TaxID=337506 RepID=UPI003FCE7975
MIYLLLECKTTLKQCAFKNLSILCFFTTLTLLNTDLIDLLTKTKFAVSLDDTRYNLNGIYLHTDEQFLYCVATDGHRLSCIKRPKLGNINGKFGVIIPHRRIKFTCGEYILISKLIDGTFQNYKAEVKKLSDVIDRVSVVVSDKVKSIKFAVQEKVLTLHSNSQECNDATESIEVDYNEAPIEIGFNSRYLLDVLSCIKYKCKFSLADGNNATIIIDEVDSSHLLLPTNKNIQLKAVNCTI